MDTANHAHHQFRVVPSPDGAVLPVTKFERKFRKQGVPIYRLTLRRLRRSDRRAHSRSSPEKFNSTAPVSSWWNELIPRARSCSAHSSLIRSCSGNSLEVAMIKRGRTASRNGAEPEITEDVALGQDVALQVRTIAQQRALGFFAVVRHEQNECARRDG